MQNLTPLKIDLHYEDDGFVIDLTILHFENKYIDGELFSIYITENFFNIGILFFNLELVLRKCFTFKRKK